MLEGLSEGQGFVAGIEDGKRFDDELASFRYLETLKIIDRSLGRAYSCNDSGVGSKKENSSEAEADASKESADGRLINRVK